MKDLERFKKFVVVNPITGCHLWRGARSHAGYGQFGFGGDGQTVFAHRFAYEQAKGPIPDGMHLDHLCVHPRCVNPDHLEPVTPEENNRRSISHAFVYLRNELKAECNKGHSLTGDNLKIDARGYRVCLKCEHIRSRQSMANHKARGWRKVSEVSQ